MSGVGNRTMQLSVCVIGRNEARNLARCAASLAQLGDGGIDFETIFVDSASTDDSVAIARAAFGTVICLAPSPTLNAGAARAVATDAARGTWILYMDGDMALSEQALPAIKELVGSGDPRRGLCAYTENVYPDGTRDLIEFRGNIAGAPCRLIGGTSILPALAVREAGNWASTLFAYEEAELYARLLARGVTVVWQACKLVDHHTPKVEVKHKLKGALFPQGSYLGKKFYGAGQVTRLTLRNGNFIKFSRLKPEASSMLAGVLVGALLLPVFGWFALLLPALVFSLTCMFSGVRSAVNAVCWQMQVAWGFGKLDPLYRATVMQVHQHVEPSVARTGYRI